MWFSRYVPAPFPDFVPSFRKPWALWTSYFNLHPPDSGVITLSSSGLKWTRTTDLTLIRRAL